MKKQTPKRAGNDSLAAANKNLALLNGGLQEALSHSVMILSNQRKTIALLEKQSAALIARIATLEKHKRRQAPVLSAVVDMRCK